MEIGNEGNNKRRRRRAFLAVRAPLVMTLGVIAVFWKLVLTKQYTFLELPDEARQILPWLNVQAYALRHHSLLLWNPYEAAGQSLIGQVQPAVMSPFTWLLALAPLSPTGHIQIAWVHLWFVILHLIAAWFAYALFRDLRCTRAGAAIGGLFYATSGYIGNIAWPQILGAAIWTPLVFLFLLRALRGRTPMKSAAWAGITLGASWLGGHHVPSTYLTLAAFGTGLYYLVIRSGYRVTIAKRLGVMLVGMCLIGAVQILPAVEYGRTALRWTNAGPRTWSEWISISEHEDLGMKPMDLIHIVVPGGSGLLADPFVGCVALSLAVLAIACRFRNRYVRIFSVIGICGLLASMPKNNVFYGPLYALVPVVERAREPVEAFLLFQFSLAVLVAMGAGLLVRAARLALTHAYFVVRLLLWFGGVTLGLFYLRFYINIPSALIDGDGRMGVIALLALLLAGICHAVARGLLRPRVAIIAIGALLVLEQGNEVGFWGFVHESDTARAIYLKPIRESQDAGDFIRRQPSPRRVEWNQKDVEFSFGDWNRVDGMGIAGASAPESFHRLDPWTDRISQLYGVGYTVSRAPTRPNQREIFSGAAGYKVFSNPDAFPRSWTVHQIQRARSEEEARSLTARGPLDLRATAVMTVQGPAMAQCPEPDQIESVVEQPEYAEVSVRMACRGLLIVSDNWYPGWKAEVDGKAVEILRVDTAIRGIALEAGQHRVEMSYRPRSVMLGVLLLVIGLGAATYAQFRTEADGADVLAEIPLSARARSGL